MKPGTLYIIATPLGNLGDISLRALETLKVVDMIAAEDTRVAKKLLSHFQIQKVLIRYDEHSHERSKKLILDNLKEGKSLALVTDAGTPAIADPGARLIAYIRKEAPEIAIHPIPGASALITALSVSGLPADRFTFLGYAPHKKGRETFFIEVKECLVRPVVFYETPHRILKTLDNLGGNIGNNEEIFIAREITKLHEEIYWKTISDWKVYLSDKEKCRGEFVIVIK